MSDGLFNPEAFEQMPGQMSMETDDQATMLRWLRAGEVDIASRFAQRDVDYPQPLPVEPMPSTYRWAL